MGKEHRAETIQPVPQSYQGWMSKSDLVVALQLACCGAGVLLPQSLWPRVALALARLHRLVKGSRAREFDDHCRRFLNADGRTVELGMISAFYEENMEALRELLPGGRERPIALRGAETIAAALQHGRGVVLWVSKFAHGDLVTKKGLARGGYRAVHLSNPGHPFSRTRVGSAILNPVRVRPEDRYISKRVLVRYGNAAPALQLLKQALRENKVVTVTALGTGQHAKEIGFLGGTLRMALGAPRLARETGAALIPVFTVPAETGGYAVCCGPDLRQGGRRELDDSDVVARLAELLEPHVRAHPAEWQAWFSPTWRPEPPS